MLKRSDLAKQFELVVKQEIINHNEAIFANNKALNQIRKDILALDQELSKNVASLVSELTKEKIAISKVYSYIDENEDKASSKIDVVRDLLKKGLDSTNNHLNDLFSKCVSKDIFNVFKESGLKAFDQLKKGLEALKHVFIDEIKDLEKRFSRVIDGQNDKLDEVPILLEKFKKDLIQRIEIDKIDSIGLKREIEVLKKSLYIESKKIENLYTLIDRLKNK